MIALWIKCFVIIGTVVLWILLALWCFTQNDWRWYLAILILIALYTTVAAICLRWIQ